MPVTNDLHFTYTLDVFVDIKSATAIFEKAREINQSGDTLYSLRDAVRQLVVQGDLNLVVAEGNGGWTCLNPDNAWDSNYKRSLEAVLDPVTLDDIENVLDTEQDFKARYAAFSEDVLPDGGRRRFLYFGDTLTELADVLDDGGVDHSTIEFAVDLATGIEYEVGTRFTARPYTVPRTTT